MPTVILVNEGDGPAADRLDRDTMLGLARIYEGAASPPRLVTFDGRGEIQGADGSSSPSHAAPHMAQSVSLDITIRGSGAPLVLRDRLLPIALSVEVDDIGRESWIEVEAKSHDGRFVPPAARFRVLRKGRSALRLDIRPNSQGDSWTVGEVDVATGQVTPLAPVSSRPPPASIDRLAVIFDRTCPDEGKWGRAWEISLGIGRMPTGGFLAADEEGEGEEIPQAEVNSEIRRTLGPAITRALGEDTPVDCWWFADQGGDGVVCPHTVNMPERPFSEVGAEASGHVDRLVQNLTWAPGLDLWDALDEALNAASIRLVDERENNKAILIVGNSPPTFPREPDTPFFQVRNAMGHSTAVRQKTFCWKEALDRCREARIPIVYLFLTHSAAPFGLERSFDVFRQVQTEVRRALDACGIHVVAEPATEEGLFRGMNTAKRHLMELRDLSAVKVTMV
ncbi:hypothetical protein [Rhodospirillum sp. A1_3_36]|uniref:hypothetical protein n=1 Tax=Rhodospirillum sp. A1_3_36 TaxID=3391666 RepID=UPI0039A68055